MAKRDDPQFRIRLPADLKKKIEESAKASGRSLNTEIEKRLERSFSDSSDRLFNDVNNSRAARAYSPSEADVGKFFIIANVRAAKQSFIQAFENMKAIENGMKVDEVGLELAKRSLKSAELSYKQSLDIAQSLDLFREDMLIDPDEIRIGDIER